MKSIWMVLFGIYFLLTPLQGSGFGVYEQGAQGHGNAGAFVARVEDGSAIYYNPAGLAFLDYSELFIGAKPVFSKSFYSNPGQSTWGSEDEFGALPALYWNQSLGRFAYGLGANTSFDYELDWDRVDFPGRFLATGFDVEVQEYLAAASIRIKERFALGATVRLAQADYRLNGILARPLDTANPALFFETEQRFQADGDGIGFTLGLLYKRPRRFSIGIGYQSAIDLDLEGDRVYRLMTRTDDVRAQSLFDREFANAPAATTLSLPERFVAGFATRITVRTRVEVDVSVENWSKTQNTTFDTLDSDGQPEQVVFPRRWDDVFSVRVSGDFQQRKALLWRMGIGTSRGVAPTDTVGPDFPDNDRFMYALGFSYTLRERYILEVSWLYTQNRDLNVTGQELIFANQAPEFVIPTGQAGLYETQRTHLHFGLRIRFGVTKP